MTTFDAILPHITSILRHHVTALPCIGQLFINRDLNGRVRLIVDDKVQGNALAMHTLTTIAHAVENGLGPHAYPAQSAILYEADLELACAGATVFPLEGFETVQVIDRLATESHWTSIAPLSQGAPRIVFFSIKGGVGRSTALAACAWVLAQEGKKVLVLDLDLESPGLSSALLPDERQPVYGITDWLVEDLVDNGEAVFDDLIATSPLTHDGEIYIVPACGHDPGDYVAKLGRVWMPKVGSDGIPKPWSQRLSHLINALEDRLEPDVMLIDSRAGIDEVASACITDLGAELVLLFAIDGDQTWSGYQMLLRHWQRTGQAMTIRDRLQMVGAMIPEDRHRDYFGGLRERAWNVFAESLYDEIPAGELSVDRFNFDEMDQSAPHYPWPVLWTRGFFALRSLHSRFESIDEHKLQQTFGELITGLKTVTDQERTTTPSTTPA